MIKVVAFDLDDTLWAVHPVIIKAEAKLGTWLQTEIPELRYDMAGMREFRDEVVLEDPGIVHRLTAFRRRLIELALLRSGLAKERALEIATAAMEVFLDARNDIEFFEGALDAIGHISARYKVGALTNGNADIVRLGLSSHFSFAFSAEEVGAPKPEPDLFHKALSHSGCAPSEMIYVGDDPIKDIDPANAVGLHTIWIKNELRPGPGISSPDRTIAHLNELVDAIADIDR